jgi:hypothetical protein
MDSIHVADDNDKEHTIWVYGTHLEDCDDQNGRFRWTEMKHLLETIASVPRTTSTQHAGNTKRGPKDNMIDETLIIGVFNDQRQQDYTPEEWEMIVDSKKRRDSPVDDGVAQLLHQHGFSCVWDKAADTMTYTNNTFPDTNWNASSNYPPSTHWSGTIVDYTYYRACSLRLQAVYVGAE